MAIIGIDAGGTWIKAGKFTRDLKVEKKIKLKSGAERGSERYFDSIAKAVQVLLTGTDISEAKIGLALPAVLSPDHQQIIYMANVAGLNRDKQSIQIGAELKSRLGNGFFVVDNDASCAAMAEWQLGVGQGDKKKRLLHITWGTGVGSALIANGESQYGWEGGHLPLAGEESGGFQCNCGSNIDLESRAAVPSLVKRVVNLLGDADSQAGLQLSDLDDKAAASVKIVQAAKAGDAVAQKALDETLRWLARGIGAMAVIAQPDIVTVGGAAMSEDWLLDQLRREVGALGGFMDVVLQPAMVQRAQLGNTAGIIGAAMLVA